MKSDLLNPRHIYYTADALNHRGRAILDKFPEAARTAVAQHNRLPATELAHYKAKSDLLVLGRLKSLKIRDNGRSADFIAPSLANGCYGACAYCYVDRHKVVNPVTLFTNTEEILQAVDQHSRKQPWPKAPNQTHRQWYTYDMGCNADISADAHLSDHVEQTVDFFRQHPRTMGTFATKFVNEDLLKLRPEGKMRVRFSLMPPAISKLTEVRTDSVEQRIAAINRFWQAGYQVHLNFSPVIVYGGKQWREDYRQLFARLNQELLPEVKRQAACEVIFLTHHAGQHQANLCINPKAEGLLWQPALQETKTSSYGGVNLRYKLRYKKEMVRIFSEMLASDLPWCPVRYIF